MAGHPYRQDDDHQAGPDRLGQVGRIISRVCADELDPERLENLYDIGIDEVSWKRQHNYLTLDADHVRGQIVWGTKGNDGSAANRFFRSIGKSRATRSS